MSDPNAQPASPEKEKETKKIIVEHQFVVPTLPTTTPTPTNPPDKEKETETPTTPIAPIIPTSVPAPIPTSTSVGETDIEKLKVEKAKLEADLRKLREDEANPELAGSKAAIQSELEKRTAALNVIAMKEFEADKKALLDKVTKNYQERGFPQEEVDKKVKEIDDSLDTPEALEHTTWVMDKMFGAPTQTPQDEGTENPPPKSKSGNSEPAPPDEGKIKHMKRIDELFNIIADPTKTREEKVEADRKLSELYITIGKAYKQTHKLPIPIMMACPSCSSVIVLPNKDAPEKCAVCGWTQQKTK